LADFFNAGLAAVFEVFFAGFAEAFNLLAGFAAALVFDFAAGFATAFFAAAFLTVAMNSSICVGAGAIFPHSFKYSFVYDSERSAGG
jgi:hypothetical protein